MSTYCSSQHRDGKSHEKDEKKRAKKDSMEEKKEDATQHVSVTLPANVQTVTLEDSDDDLEV